ncbi:MAG: hypothetical protein AAF497_28310, partial [Planctomycetota bacterium]
MQALEELTLADQVEVPSSVGLLKEAVNLRKLEIRATEEYLDGLQRLKQVEHLYLIPSASQALLAGLGELTGLKHLQIYDTNLDDEAIRVILPFLSRLRTLDLQFTRVTDEAFADYSDQVRTVAIRTRFNQEPEVYRKKISARPPAEWASRWLSSPQLTDDQLQLVETGRSLFELRGCKSCHKTTANAVSLGPTFAGEFWGSKRSLRIHDRDIASRGLGLANEQMRESPDYEKKWPVAEVPLDERYVWHAIRNGAATSSLSHGSKFLMPESVIAHNNNEMAALVAYIKSLSREEEPNDPMASGPEASRKEQLQSLPLVFDSRESKTAVVPQNQLIARFTFDKDAADTVGRHKFLLQRVPIREGSIYLNGNYFGDDRCDASLVMPTLNYEAFTIMLRFRAQSYSAPERRSIDGQLIPNQTGDRDSILTGGVSNRWFSLSRASSGQLRIWLNGEVEEIAQNVGNTFLEREKWTTLVFGVDLHQRRIRVVLDGRHVAELKLPEHFRFYPQLLDEGLMRNAPK